MLTYLERLRIMDEVVEFKKRAFAKLRKLNTVDIKNDSRISVVGSVITIDSKNLFFSFDDGTKVINVLLTNEEQLKKIKPGKRIRVIGVIMSFDDSYEIRAEIISDFTGLNISEYNDYLKLSKA